MAGWGRINSIFTIKARDLFLRSGRKLYLTRGRWAGRKALQRSVSREFISIRV